MNLPEAILRDADRCVLCGMCLPHCPTYVRSGNEAESPRGRISLMLALARGELEATPALIAHLDSCLTCRACESKCPSEVRYGRLIGNARRLIAERHRPALRTRLLTAVTSRSRLLQFGAAVARSGFGRRLLRSLGLGTAAALVETSAPAPVVRASAAGERSRGRVALFSGCTGEAFDQETLSAAQTLLEAAGYTVEIPHGQTCCGALHHHQGDRKGFERRARQNLRIFADDWAGDWDAVVFVASGCGAMLREYNDWLEDADAAPFAAKCVEITDFLARNGFPEEICFDADDAKIAFHLPCSQSNMLKSGGAVERLLRRIRGATLSPLPNNNVCCGAAGSHMLTHAESAEALREPKLDALERSGAHFLVTTNVGCALHLRAGARARQLEVEVLHPVALLARCLKTNTTAKLAATEDCH